LKILAGDLTWTVVKQSEAILLDPSMYWISVINVGRYFGLDEVMGSNMKDSDGVGRVIARLMKVADVLAMSPASIAFSSSVDDVHDSCLIETYLKSIDFDVPSLSAKNAPTLLLHIRESEAHRTPNDEYYVTDDPKVNGKSKMKKAFCEPGNISFCPPITLASTFSLSQGDTIVVSRSEENGGNVTFASIDEINAAYSSGSLHPGDLKAASALIMVQVLDKLSAGLKGVTKSVKALKAMEKKMAKQSKKA